MEAKFSVANSNIISSGLETISNINIASEDSLTIKTKNDYHSQSLSQANISFYYSLAGGAIGFIVIIVSLFANSDRAWLGVVSGTIIDAVSGLLFYQTNQARKVMTDFFDKLRVDTKISESLELCNSINSSDIQDRLKVKLSLYYAGIDGDHLNKCSEEILCNFGECKKLNT